jgi:hypothetical protein
MKSITFLTLSGKSLFIDNVGDGFLVTDLSHDVLGHFSSLDKAIEFVLNKA